VRHQQGLARDRQADTPVEVSERLKPERLETRRHCDGHRHLVIAEDQHVAVDVVDGHDLT
jgi:hypothetical protein